MTEQEYQSAAEGATPSFEMTALPEAALGEMAQWKPALEVIQRRT